MVSSEPRYVEDSHLCITGYLNQSGTFVLATGLPMHATGIYLETDTGVHHCHSGSARTTKRFAYSLATAA